MCSFSALELWDSQGRSLQCWDVKGFFSSQQQLQEIVSDLRFCDPASSHWRHYGSMTREYSGQPKLPRLLACLSMMVAT